MVYQCRVLIHNKIILFMIPDFLVTLYIRNSTLPTISPKSPSCLARIMAAASYLLALLFILLSYNLISIQWSEWALKNLKHSPWWLSYKESTCNVGDLGSIPGLGRAPGEGNGYLLQYSGLKNSMDCIVLGLQRVRHDWVTFTEHITPQFKIFHWLPSQE